MNKLLLTFLVLTSGQVYSQTTISGNLTSSDTINLKILNAYPESFPLVSLMFKAETNDNRPIWKLSKKQVNVWENSTECKIDSFTLISQNQSIKISLVLDHSGSMLISEEILDTLKYPEMAKFIYDGFLYLPEGYELPKEYVPPINHAKKAIRTFTNSFNSTKDSINLIGFSSSVDINLPFTNDISKIDSTLSLIQADSMTAFYDALNIGIENLSQLKGLKVLVALTDGLDNASVTNFNKIVATAYEESIPIHIIGLGEVNKDSLQMLANSTNGHFYHTTNASALDSLYTIVSKSIQSIYNLQYHSKNLSYIDSTREILLDYNIDSLYVNQAIINMTLPSNIITELKIRNKQRTKKMVIGGLMILVIVAASGMLYYKIVKK